METEEGGCSNAGQRGGRGGWKCQRWRLRGGEGKGRGEWEAMLVAAAAYMARMERLYAVDSAVAADDGNDGSGGRGGEAGAPGGDGITRVNGQAAATAAAVEEEEEEGAADRDGDHVADGDGGPVANDGDGNDPQRRSSRRPTPSPSLSQSSVRDLVWSGSTSSRISCRCPLHHNNY